MTLDLPPGRFLCGGDVSMGLPSWASEPAASSKSLVCVVLPAVRSMAVFLGPPRELGAERDQMSISPGDHGQLVNVVRH